MERTDYDNEVTPVMLDRLRWLQGATTSEMAICASAEIGRLRDVMAEGIAELRSLKANDGNLQAETRVALIEDVIQLLVEGMDPGEEAAQ